MSDYEFLPEAHEIGTRLDVFITSRIAPYSRSAVKSAIDSGCAFVCGKPAKANRKLKTGDIIRLYMPPADEPGIFPQDIPLDILYEDGDVIVINKPKGLVVHPGAGNYEKTLVNALLFHCGACISELNGRRRAGIVHRIDKDTSGVIVAAKTDSAHRFLGDQFSAHSITRKYIAVTKGIVKEDSGVIDKPIGRCPNNRVKMAVNYKNGKPALTRYKVLERFRKYTLIEAVLETGRTHQIRVHLSSIAHPLAGDFVYGTETQGLEKPLNGQALHAQVLGFIHPVTNRYTEFAAPPPENFLRFLETVRN